MCCASLFQSGCKSPAEYRVEADKVAAGIITAKQQQALGRTEDFTIERPSDIFRRRLLTDQNLPYSGPASFGADALEKIEHWPEKDYPKAQPSLDPIVLLEKATVVKLSLIQALQIGARNSFQYQSHKEDVFLTALDLDLERNEFRNIFTGEVRNLISTDLTGDRTVSGAETGAKLDLSRKFQNGAEFTTNLAMDLASLLTANGASSFGIAGDASIEIPLLRGSGRHIAREPLTQAERNVIYAIWEFERFKRTFAVDIAAEYLSVLQQLDRVRNAEDNYRSLMASARWSRRLANAGRRPEIEVDQAVQRELGARDGWISTVESYKRSLDAFNNLLSLPTDAQIELDRAELGNLTAPALKIMDEITRDQTQPTDSPIAPADAVVELVAPSREDAGPLEMDEDVAIRLALDSRLDLRTAIGGVYDAQRAVVIAADGLRAELTVLGSAGAGDRRTVGTATSDDADLRIDKGAYSALLTLDLPFERTEERNLYRASYIALERAVRDVQILEDSIKLEIRNKLRDMLEARESLKIQAQSVIVAEKRVKSSQLFLEAGRAEIRDLLEAQDSLLAAQNGLTSAAVSYRVAELELQRDLGLLEVDAKGLWREMSPEEINNVKN